jgi:carbon monoxide dehydrogenase subunit G
MTEPGRLFASIPGVESIDSVNGKLKVKFRLDLEKIGITDAGGYMSTITSVMLFEYELEGHEFLMKGKGRSAGSSVSTEIAAVLSEDNDSTRLDWKADVDTGLILKMLGERRVSAASGTLISMIIEGFRHSLLSS